jgi:hypothetical protein
MTIELSLVTCPEYFRCSRFLMLIPLRATPGPGKPGGRICSKSKRVAIDDAVRNRKHSGFKEVFPV